MSTKILSRHWSEEDLTTSGIVIGPDLICEALQGYWKAYSTGHAGHKQVRLTFGGDGSKEIAHEAFFHAYSGMKTLHFAPSNGTRNQSTTQVDLTLRNEVTGRHLMSLDGVAIAAGRTGWFALACASLLAPKRDIEVFIFGAGRIAEAVILSLDLGAASKIKSVAVLSRHGISNRRLVEKLAPRVKLQLFAVSNRELLKTANLVIAATNADGPVFDTTELAFSAVTLSFGTNELPSDYMPIVMTADGSITRDDVDELESFTGALLSLHHRGSRSEILDSGTGHEFLNSDVITLPSPTKPPSAWEGPLVLSPTGFASLDVAIAVKIYDRLQAKTTDTLINRLYNEVLPQDSRSQH